MSVLLEFPISHISNPMIARLVGFDTEGRALISSENGIIKGSLVARSLCLLEEIDIGDEVLVLYLDESENTPVIMGKIHQNPLVKKTEKSVDVNVDGKRITLEASEYLELKCGKAHILLQSDGRIKIRGGYLLSHASGINRIRGAAVKVN